MIKDKAAIYDLYSSVVSIDGSYGERTPMDANGNEVSVDWDAVNSRAAELVTEQKLIDLRAERNKKLAETDWTQSRDVTLSNDSAWKTYRQELRDITDSAKSLDDVTWPKKPE